MFAISLTVYEIFANQNKNAKSLTLKIKLKVAEEKYESIGELVISQRFFQDGGGSRKEISDFTEIFPRWRLYDKYL